MLVNVVNAVKTSRWLDKFIIDPSEEILKMLQCVLGRRDLSGLLLVEDSLEEPSRALAQCLITSWVTRGDSVQVLSFDKHPQDFLRPFADSVKDKVSVLDGFTEQSFESYDLYLWMERLSNQKEPFVLMIDSLTTILMHEDFQDVYRALMCLSRKACIQLVVALVHQDVHGEREVDQLRRLATTVLAPVATAAGLPLCRVVHRKPGGRVTREEQEFTVEAGFTITNIKKVEQKKVAKEVAKPDPAANLTFNLRLTSDEREARDGLVLPYLKAPSAGGSGEISYVMEREDDFDEEDDPDDDLDF